MAPQGSDYIVIGVNEGRQQIAAQAYQGEDDQDGADQQGCKYL
jgi:hypothetical protein